LAKDVVHQAVKNALIKDEWLITDDPYTLDFGGVNIAVDLGAEKLIAATKDNQKIAVEAKSFWLHVNFEENQKVNAFWE
jgi:hypothetical protein